MEPVSNIVEEMGKAGWSSPEGTCNVIIAVNDDGDMVVGHHRCDDYCAVAMLNQALHNIQNGKVVQATGLAADVVEWGQGVVAWLRGNGCESLVIGAVAAPDGSLEVCCVGFSTHKHRFVAIIEFAKAYLAGVRTRDLVSKQGIQAPNGTSVWIEDNGTKTENTSPQGDLDNRGVQAAQDPGQEAKGHPAQGCTPEGHTFRFEPGGATGA